MADTPTPDRGVPAGRRVRLPGRGTTFVRDVAGPVGAPTVVLLHGLGATASINWPGAFDALSSQFRVVALDQAGHGRGVRSRRPFRLEDCADDVARLADTRSSINNQTIGCRLLWMMASQPGLVLPAIFLIHGNTDGSQSVE